MKFRDGKKILVDGRSDAKWNWCLMECGRSVDSVCLVCVRRVDRSENREEFSSAILLISFSLSSGEWLREQY
jgi:hypothetical protein